MNNRVLVIGLDGATWDVLDAWIRDGSLPNLARLCESGCRGSLRSTIPPITAAAWSSFMTGKRPGKHGVFHFIKLFDDGVAGDDAELVSSRSLKSPALWDSMGHHGRNAVMVNIPLTYPPRPVNGAMITGLLTPSSASVFTYPPELSAQLTDYQIDLDRFMDKTPFVDAFDARTTAPSLALVEEFRAMEDKRARVCLELMDAQPWDFYMVVFTATDRMGHYLWPYHRSPRPDDSPAVRRLCEAVRALYIRLDEIVGQLIERAGDDASVLIMSDHGMGPTFSKRFHCNNWLRRHGWLTAVSGHASLASPDSLLRRLRLPRDAIGRLIHRIPGLAETRLVSRAANSRSETVDTAKSVAYCVPIFHNIVGIRIRGTAAEKDSVCQAIMAALQQLVDPETGLQIVQQVCRAEDYYAGPYADNIPDLIAVFDPDYGCNHHLSHYSSLVTKRPDASGPARHRIDGIFIASGPHIASQPQPLPNLQIEDVAPTALHLMGLPVPYDMDGRVLIELLEPATAAQPVHYEEPLGFWPEKHAAVFSEAVMTDEDEAVIRGRLRSLGYFE